MVIDLSKPDQYIRVTGIEVATRGILTFPEPLSVEEARAIGRAWLRARFEEGEAT